MPRGRSSYEVNNNPALWRTKTVLSANFSVSICDNTWIISCTQVIHFVASLTSSSKAFFQGHLR